MRNCFLHGYGPCDGKISGEHYISETVLKAIGASGSVQIGGLTWQPNQTLQRIGIASLVSNILCETHNSGLSELDDAAGRFFRAIDSADKRPASLPSHTIVNGLLVEKWFLKVLCGLSAGKNFKNQNVSDEWKLVLSGQTWPDGWGLYIPSPTGTQVLATEFYLETFVDPENLKILAARFRVAGVLINLVLGQPDNPEYWGVYRPQYLIFRDVQNEKLIELAWPFHNNGSIIYTKIGSSRERAPQWSDWTE